MAEELPTHSGLMWCPIETAPKDGTRILAAARRGKEDVILVTWWRNIEDRTGYVGWGEFNDQQWPATHWMPLPEAPRR